MPSLKQTAKRAMTALQNLLSTGRNEPIEWYPHGIGKCYVGTMAGEALLLTLNNFPDEPLFTVYGLDDAVDIEDVPWHLRDAAAGVDYGRGRLDRIREELLSLGKTVEWRNTSSPLVFRYDLGAECVYWKHNVYSIHDHSLVTRHGRCDLDAVPDGWVMQEALGDSTHPTEV